MGPKNKNGMPETTGTADFDSMPWRFKEKMEKVKCATATSAETLVKVRGWDRSACMSGTSSTSSKTSALTPVNDSLVWGSSPTLSK